MIGFEVYLVQLETIEHFNLGSDMSKAQSKRESSG